MMRAPVLPALLAAAAAAACAVVGEDYDPPAAPAEAVWREASPELSPEPADLAAWWMRFEDPVLDALIQRAALQSLDQREALARVEEARALRGVARADFYPALDGTASYTRSGESKFTPFGAFVPDNEVYAARFDASWEVDLWGRVRRLVEAADADLAASVEDARGVAVTVAAETAVNYVDLRAFQARVAIARTNVELQEQTLDLARARYEAGLVGERDVAQAATNLERTRSRVPSLEVGLRTAENRLAVLLGLTPGALAAELAEVRPIPVPPVAVAVGVPADLLRRRADVRQAERHLAAESARIGVAEGELYPKLTLLGSLGIAAEDTSDLTKDEADTFSIGPSVRWNLFDGGRLRNRVEAQDARAEQAFVQWERAVLTAFEESENAMTAFVQEQARRGSLTEAVAQARLASELARTQYREGLSDFQVVLDSDRALAELEDELAQSDSAIATSLVTLYKALGGGWEHMQPPV